MEPLFQVSYFITQSNLSEYYKKATPLWASIIYYPAMILIAGALTYWVFRELATFIFSAILSILILYIAYEQNIKSYRIYYKRYLVNKLENLERIIDFGDSINVSCPSTGTKSIFEYAQIKQIMQTKHLYILMLPYRLSIYFEKDKFTIGNETDFKTFINSKCDHLRSKM